MQNIYFYAARIPILLMKSAKFIHERVTEMTLELQKIKLLDNEQLLPIK